KNFATLDATRLSDQPHQSQRNSGLARSGFTHQTELLALPQAEANLFNCFHRAPRRVVTDPQVPHAEHLHSHVRVRSLGFAISSSPAEMRNSPTNRNTMTKM